MRTLDPASIVRGQFRGYRQEPGVAADSQVETFAALRLFMDNWRWGGVPFYIRAGQEHAGHRHGGDRRSSSAPRRWSSRRRRPGRPNYLRFRLSPDIVIALGRAPALARGEQLDVMPVELELTRHPTADSMEPYERLLGLGGPR